MPDSSNKGSSKPVELHFTHTNGPVDDAIDQLISQLVLDDVDGGNCELLGILNQDLLIGSAADDI